jgi:predicted secreted protein
VTRGAALAVMEAAIDTLSAVFGVKATGDEPAAFGAALDALVTRAYRGKLKASALASQMRALIAQYIRAAYVAAFESTGLDESELDDADNRLIADMLSEQEQYVVGFADAVIAAKSDSELRDAIDTRVGYWQKSVRAAGQAAITSVNGKQIVRWQIGHTDERCDTCVGLDGVAHTRKWFADRGYFPATPGAEGLICRGYRCDCQLLPVKRGA